MLWRQVGLLLASVDDVGALMVSVSAVAGQKMAGTFPYWVAMWGEVIVCTRMGIFVPTIDLLIGSAAQRDNEPDLPKPSTSPPQNNTHCEIVSLVYCPTTMDIT